MTAATAAPTHRGQRRAAGPLTGLRSLLRLHLRLARRGILIWTLAVLVLVPASIYAMEDVYPDQAALDARAALLDNPSAVMMTGPFFAADHYTFWAMVANELLLYLLVPAAIMSILLTARLTRSARTSSSDWMETALTLWWTRSSRKRSSRRWARRISQTARRKARVARAAWPAAVSSARGVRAAR